MSGQTLVSPVGNLLQVDLFVAVQQLGDIVTDDPDKEGDEDDGKNHPQPDAGVQQELWTSHRSLFDSVKPKQTRRRSDGDFTKNYFHNIATA